METQKAIELNRKIIRIVTIIGIILTIILGWLVAKNDYFAIDGPFRESIAHSGWGRNFDFYPNSNYASSLPDYSGRLNLCHRAYRIRASLRLDL